MQLFYTIYSACSRSTTYSPAVEAPYHIHQELEHRIQENFESHLIPSSSSKKSQAEGDINSVTVGVPHSQAEEKLNSPAVRATHSREF